MGKIQDLVKMKLRSGRLFLMSKIHPEDINPDVADARARHNQGTILLQMPLEIRTMIYGFVIGHNTVHVTQDYGPLHIHHHKTSHILCTTRHEDAFLHHAFKTVPTRKLDNYYIPFIEDVHNECYETLHRLRNHPPSKMSRVFRSPAVPKMSLDLLRVCRQIYKEAHLIPMQTNAFNFHCNVVLKIFIRSASNPPGRPPQLQLCMLRVLSLDIQIQHPDEEDAWEGVIRKLPYAFPQLKDVTIIVHEMYCVCWVETVRDRMENRGMYVAMRRLGRRLPDLRVFRLMIDDNEFLEQALGEGWWGKNDEWMDEFGRYRWTVKQKRDFCAMMERMVLGKDRCHPGKKGKSGVVDGDYEDDDVQIVKVVSRHRSV